MTSQTVREAWFRYIRMSDEERLDFRELLDLHEDEDLIHHLDPNHPFTLEIGGEG
jgi:hypothetical protein